MMFGKDKKKIQNELEALRFRINSLELELQLSKLMPARPGKESSHTISIFSADGWSASGIESEPIPVNKVVELILTHLGLSIEHQPEKTVLVKSKVKSRN